MDTAHRPAGGLHPETLGGLLLLAAATAALLLANGPLEGAYRSLLATPGTISIGSLGIHKPLQLWINDGLMAIFFFAIGLELKREVLHGELARPAQAMLPAIAAAGGMLVPALLYRYFAGGDGDVLRGWAVPTATDIAFALGVLSLFGRRVPPALKVFLLGVAIIDDLGAIIVIALFYTSELSALSFVLAGSALAVLVLMNRLGVSRTAPYVLVGFFMWACVLKSGVHATLAGVLLALTIPYRRGDGSLLAPELERGLHPWVAFLIVPAFAFANAGLPLAGVDAGHLLAPVTLGVAAGLFLGKQLGVFGTVWLAVRLGIAVRPAGTGWLQLYGVSLLCGIGFTMSLFITTLAWPPGSVHIDEARLGILLGTTLSTLAGVGVLAAALRR